MSEKLAEYSAEWWDQEISKASKTLDDKWRVSAQKVVDRYLDDRSEDMTVGNVRKYNIFWANVQILKSALYATPPAPEVKRQHDDAKDDIARTGALMLERILNFGFQADDSADHEAFQLAVEDRLIPGLGQVWLRYDPTIVPFEQNGVKGEQIVDEQVRLDFVHWNDFIWSPARVWSEVWWVGRRVWMKKQDFITRFGEELYTELTKELQDTVRQREGYPKGFEAGRVEVFELWCEATRKAYWVHRGTKKMLDEKDDPYKLDKFFPCPPPLLATHTTNSLIPRPDYVMCQDQYDELDVLNDRIHTLTKALRVVGVYDSGTSEIATVLTGAETRMIAVDNWAVFAEKGGMKGSVDWFPVDQIQKVLQGLIEQRQLVIQQIYELTSISDIMRGVSQARETAKAQTLKAQYSSVRLQLTQQAVAKFVCSALRIKVEMICKLFQPQTIIQQSQVEFTESAEFAQPAVQLLKDYRATQYRIQVGEESLSLADYNAEREMRTEFLMGIGQFLSQAAPLVQNMPGAMPYLLQMIQWVAASFRGADDIETVLDAAAQAAKDLPMQQEEQAPPPPPDHSLEVAQINAQTTLQKAEMDNQTKLQIAEADRVAKAEESARALEAKQQEGQARMEFEGQQKNADREMAAKPPVQLNMDNAVQPLVDAVERMGEMQIQAAEAQTQAAQMTAQALQGLAQALAKKKRRVPVRDGEGNILYTEDVDVDGD